jgi:hypothetical protein
LGSRDHSKRGSFTASFPAKTVAAFAGRREFSFLDTSHFMPLNKVITLD